MADENTFRKKWGFLVGVNSYKHVRKLSYGKEDALGLSNVLTGKLGFQTEDVLTFVEGSEDFLPERANILHYLGEVKNRGQIAENDLLIFFFSGHGMIGKEDGKDYLLPIEASPNALTETGLQLENIAKRLEDTGCKNIVMFIDACRETVTGGTSKGVVSVGQDSVEALRRAGIVTFFSCDPKEQSFEIEQLKHGSFTHCILEAIDKNEAGTVSALDQYLRRRVPVINSENKMPPQLPFTVVEPIDKNDLPIFLNFVQQQTTQQKMTDLNDAVVILYDEDYIDADTLNLIAEYLYSLPDTALSEEDKKVELIRKLAKKALIQKAFRMIWESMERRRTPATMVPEKLSTK